MIMRKITVTKWAYLLVFQGFSVGNLLPDKGPAYKAFFSFPGHCKASI
jgi:hypothetical protein